MSGTESKGKKRSKAYYKKCSNAGKRAKQGAHTLEPGIKGFLVMCNHNESGAVRESYNILNEYADNIYGRDQASSDKISNDCSEEEEEEEDIEKALKKEVDEIKNTDFKQKRFQSVKSRAKNCIFIQSTVEDPVLVTLKIMEDIAQNGLKKARFAARILPILGTCKANIDDIEKLSKNVLSTAFSSTSSNVPSSYTILYKSRNNNGTNCGKNQVISSIRSVITDINPQVKFSWSDFQVAILVEIVCTICCLGVAPDYTRLRKYNLQELQQGARVLNDESTKTSFVKDQVEEDEGFRLEVPGDDKQSNVLLKDSEILNESNTVVDSERMDKGSEEDALVTGNDKLSFVASRDFNCEDASTEPKCCDKPINTYSSQESVASSEVSSPSIIDVKDLDGNSVSNIIEDKMNCTENQV
ncbi:THUMP domain-containing protein 1 [Biomphalaria glabrata]|nr:THUMP domain-containing protein 1-like [Biomphalaria glabrata]